jgi:hypothetical protein
VGSVAFILLLRAFAVHLAQNLPPGIALMALCMDIVTASKPSFMQHAYYMTQLLSPLPATR